MRREFEAERLRRQDAQNSNIALAWYTAAFARQEKLPKLDSLLRSDEPKRQTIAEMRQVIKQLSEQYRIPIKERVH